MCFQQPRVNLMCSTCTAFTSGMLTMPGMVEDGRRHFSWQHLTSSEKEMVLFMRSIASHDIPLPCIAAVSDRQ